jgi:hypothetical protein
MNGDKSSRWGWVSAFLLAASYVIVGLTYIFLPAEQKGGTVLHDPDKFLVSMAQSPTLITIHHLAFALGGLIGIGVLFAVFELARTYHELGARWLTGLGFFGFVVTTIDNLKIVATEPVRAARYVAGDDTVKAIMKASDFLVSVDPQMWLAFGLTGVWALGISGILLRNRAVPRLFGSLGLAVGLIYFLVEVGTVIRSEAWLTAAALAGAVIAGPVWYAWLGLIIRRGPSRRRKNAAGPSSTGPPASPGRPSNGCSPSSPASLSTR